MKKLLSIFCTLLLISMISISSFAGGNLESNVIKVTGKSSPTSQAPINFILKECTANLSYDPPSFEHLECDLDQRVFFSSKGSVMLKDTDNWIKNGYISVRIKKPKLKRSFNLFHPTTFCKKVPVNADVNRFYIQGPKLRAPFWHPIKKLKYWWNPQYITINYGLALTDKDDEKIYSLPKLDMGMKTKAQEDEERLDKAIESHNPQQKAKVKGSFRMYDTFLLNSEKKNAKYYTAEAAKKENVENEKKREEFRRKLANLNKEEMLIEGEIARLTPDNPVCNFRLVINNNEGLNADRMALLLSAQQDAELCFEDNSKLDLEFVYVYPLPDRLKPAKEDALTLKGLLNPNEDSRINLVKEMNSAVNAHRRPLLSMIRKVVGSKGVLEPKKPIQKVINGGVPDKTEKSVQTQELKETEKRDKKDVEIEMITESKVEKENLDSQIDIPTFEVYTVDKSEEED